MRFFFAHNIGTLGNMFTIPSLGVGPDNARKMNANQRGA
jgi:hypothetical protein